MKPFDGIRVADFTRIAAGPFCTSLLGDFGAEVIKIEKPGVGDDTRHYDNVFPDADSSYFFGINRDKKSVTIDLKSPKGIEAVKKLIKTSDVLVESNRAGVMERLGLGYEDIKKVNPGIIYCSISAFGSTGPLSSKAGMDLIIQAISGIMSITGEPGKPPVKVGTPVVDFIASYAALSGISMALLAKNQTGKGQKVELNLLDGMITAYANYFSGFFVTGEPNRPYGNAHPHVVPYQAFMAKDQYIIVACLTEQFWKRFAKAIDMGYLIDDPRFVTNVERAKHRDELIAILENKLSEKTVKEWSEILDKEDVPNAPVNTLGQAFHHPQVIHNQMVVQMEHKEAGSIKIPGIPIKLSETPGTIEQAAPLLGEHNQEILAQLGYSKEEIDEICS